MLRAAILLLSAGALLVSSKVSPDPTPAEWKHLGRGQTHLLYRDYERATGKKFTPAFQGNAASCVGTSAAKALELHAPYIPFSPEYIYGESRSQFDAPWKHGSKCGWAADVLREGGAVPAINFNLVGIDLTTYSAERAADYGERGPPEALRTIAQVYKTQGYVKITNWAELRGAIAAGNPVIVGSSVGFGRPPGQVRDHGGFLRSRFWSRWMHAMVIIGVSDEGRQGALVLNSWGSHWISGPQRYGDEPAGSFWVDVRTAESILAHGDAYAILPLRIH